MTATAAEKRVWLRDHGHDVPDKGKLPAELLAEYDAAHAEPLFDDPFDNGQGADYDQGVTEADFPSEPLGPPPPESKPRRVTPPKRARADQLRARMWGPKAKTPGGRKKTPKKRVPLDRLIGRGWQILARLAAPIDLPVARVLDMQAPVAGVLLEPIVKETLLDTILQPIARLESGGETVFGLAGPPLLVGMLHRHPEAAPILIPALEEAFTVWIQIAGPAVEEARAKREAWEGGTGAEVQAMMAMVFAGIPGFDPKLEEGEPAAPDGVAVAQAMV
jgi:hypothetical protein